MAKTIRKKKVLLVQTGPLHLFWTTGVYYLWGLKDKYNFILLVDDNYLNSPNFKKIIKYFSILHIHYQKKNKGYKLIKDLYKNYINIFKSHNPDKILIHNSCFVDNQILMLICDRHGKNLKIFEYQNAKLSLNFTKDRELEVFMQANLAFGKNKYLKKFINILLLFIKFRNLLKFFYYYKILPLLIMGKTLNPHFNIYTSKFNKKKTKEIYSKVIKKYLAYIKCESSFLSNYGIKNLEIINHPVSIYGKKVNKILYKKTIEKKQISILPSLGPLEKELLKKDEGYLSKFVANQYIKFFKILLAKFPNFSIKLKLHPRQKGDNFWVKVVNLIIEKNYNIIIEKSLNAEELILQSKIIVSDISTSLWWSSFLKNKINISLDIFNFEIVKEMSHYKSKIYYINCLEKLKQTKLIPKKVNETNKNILQIV